MYPSGAAKPLAWEEREESTGGVHYIHEGHVREREERASLPSHEDLLLGVGLLYVCVACVRVCVCVT